MRHGPLRHPWFAAFTAGVATGSVADEVSRLALPLLVLDITHSLGAAATLRVVQFVPYIFFGSLAGVIIDRVDKRRLLLRADLIGVLLTAAIPLSATFDVFSLNLLMGRTMLAMQVIASLAALFMGGLRDIAMLISAFALRQIASAAWVVYAFTPRQREVPRDLRGRANGAIRAIVLVSNAASPALLSSIQSGFGTGIAYLTAGTLGLVSVVVAAFTALRDYDVRSPQDILAAEEDVEMEPTAAD